MSNVDEVRDRTDIVALISTYTALKKAGKTYKGLCPFHGEKTASFVVYPDEGRWHCFGSCATGGDAFEFVMRAEHLDFKSALELLARRAGVELAPPTEQGAARRDRRERLREALSMAGAFYRTRLDSPAGGAAREYLASRGFEAAGAADFGLGWAADEWSGLTDHLRRAGFGDRELIDAGLARERDQGSGIYDLFRGRLVFPIHDDRGRPVGFGGRTIAPDGVPKYLNSPQSELFDKGRLMYALHRAIPAIRDSGEAVVVEGYTDVLRAHTAGFTNVVASLGTALTEHHLVTLKRFAKRVVLALDADSAGQSAMTRGLEVAQQAAADIVPIPMANGWIRYEHRLEIDLRIALLPKGQDPDDVVRADPDAWRAAVADAVPVLAYMFDALTADLDLTLPTSKREAVGRLLPVLASVPDAVARAAWTEDYANRLRLDPRALAADLARAASKSGGGQQRAGSIDRRRIGQEGGSAARPVPNGKDKPGARGTDAETKLSEWLLGRILANNRLFDDLVARLGEMGQPSLSGDDFLRRIDRELFHALADKQRGAPPPDAGSDEEAGALSPEHLQRRDELTSAVRSEPPIGDEATFRALVDACLRMRRIRQQREIFGLRLLMQDASATDQEDLAIRVRTVGTELRTLEKLLMNVAPASGKVDQAVTRRSEI